MIITTELEVFLANRIAQMRIAKGVSARDMSLSIGQGAAYINNIENRKTLPSMRGFFYICEYLNISPNEFFDVDSTDPEKVSMIMQDMKKLSAEQLNNIAGIVKELAKQK